MKLLSAILLGLSLPASLGLNFPTVAAQRTAIFTCTEVEGRLATAVKTKKGDVPLVYWDSGAFTGAGFNPELRCKKVTQRFTNLYENGQLKYLVAGRVNRQPVICGTKISRSNCTNTNMLFTLKPGTDPRNVLRQLNAVRNRAASSSAVEESAGSILTNPSTDTQVDLEDWLKFTE